MAKLGHYSGQRLKIVDLDTTEIRTIGSNECGTVFLLAGGTVENTIILPSIISAGAGWWCKFILLANMGVNGATINTADSSEKIVTANYGGLGDDTLSGTVESETAAIEIIFVPSKALAGDSVEVICTGDEWLGQCFSSDDDLGLDVAL